MCCSCVVLFLSGPEEEAYQRQHARRHPGPHTMVSFTYSQTVLLIGEK